jgi:putative glutathione S-transferase
MGLLVEGKWTDRWYDTSASGGRFVRQESAFRNWITPDGAPGPTGKGGFAAARGRYHLYVSLACPWAHRTLIFRALKGLESAISLSVVNWLMGDQGWTFEPAPGVIPDSVSGAKRLYEIYLRANPTYTGRVTVPVLWDKQTGEIVSNESSEIIRMFNSAFDKVARELYQYPGVKATVSFTHIKNHYYQSHRTINPTGIVPIGPYLDFSLPHGREHLPAGSRQRLTL